MIVTGFEDYPQDDHDLKGLKPEDYGSDAFDDCSYFGH